MKNPSGTKQELIKEISSLNQRIQDLEQAELERKKAEQEQRNRKSGERLAEEMAIIAEIGLVISSTLNIDEVYERFAAETQKLISIDSLTVNIYNFQENTMRVAYVSGLDIDGRRQGDPLVLKGSLSEAVIRDRTSICIQPASIDEIVGQFPRLIPIFQAGLRSIMCVPLIYRDKVIAVLHFRSKKQNAYTEQDLRLAEKIGTQIAGTIANAQLYADLRKTEDELRESEGRLRGLADELAVIAEIGRLISSTMDIDEVYEKFAAETRKLIPFDSLIVNLKKPQEDTIDVAYASGVDIAERRKGDSFPLKGSVTEVAMRTRTGMIVRPADILRDAERFPTIGLNLQAGLHSMMSTPLISRDKAIGALVFRAEKQNAYTEPDLRLAEKIGAQIAGAIASAQLFNNLKKTDNALRESEGRFRTLVERAAVGVAEIEMSTGRFLTVNRRLCEMVGRTEEELITTTFLAITHPEDLHLHVEKTALLLAGTIGHYSLEKRYLRKDGETVWVNTAVSPLWKPGEKPERTMIVVEDITDRKRVEEALRDSEQRYWELSMIDELTKLYNSRHFYVQLKNETERSNRYEHPLTLLLLDLDNFKIFNDKYGHLEGDRVLSQFGQVMKRCLRETDSAYRYGGEEFTVLLPMTTSTEGFVTAERIRTEFKKEIFPSVPGQDVHMTVSIGLAQYKPKEEVKVFVHRVDQLMYQGKKDGKDRVCFES